MQQYLWDGDRGFFFDYDFYQRQEIELSLSPRLIIRYGQALATPEQAAAVAKHLPVFEQPGGLAMSPENSGAQWDYPYGWAPV